MNLTFWGLALTICLFAGASALSRRLKSAFLQPILICALGIMLVLTLFHIPASDYAQSVQPLSCLLLPATVCLAIPLYRQRKMLRSYLAALLAGTLAGVATAVGSVLLVAWLFGLDHAMLATLLPKSITSAFGMELAAEYGGNPALATAVIILTGIVGNIACVPFCRALKIKDPVAVGLCVGTSAHAIGTSKALELGQTEGAMAGLAMVLTGLMTTLLFPFCMAIW